MSKRFASSRPGSSSSPLSEAAPLVDPPVSAPARPRQGRGGITLVFAGGVLLVAAVVGMTLSSPGDAVAKQGPKVPAAFVAYVWSGQASGEFDASWHGGTAALVLQTRLLREPTLIEGRPHLHVAWLLPGRRKVVSQEAWFRPSEDSRAWLCARRRIGGETLDLVPPMPILKVPLETGATWTWEGKIGEESGEAEFEVLRADASGLVVRQVTRHSGAESTQTRTYEPGPGLVREEGSFPYEPIGDSVVVTRRRAGLGMGTEGE